MERLAITLRRRPALCWLLAASAAVAWQIVLVLHDLHRELTTDESFTMFTVGGGMHELARGVRSDPGMVFYYAPLFAVSRVTGSSLVALRTVSLVSWCLLVIAVCWWAARRRQAFVAAVGLIALGTTHAVRASAVDARAAAPTALLAVATVMVLHRAGRRVDGRAGAWWHVAASAAAAITAWAHPSAVGVGSVLALATAWSARHRNDFSRLLTRVALVVPAAAVAVDAISTTNFPPTGFEGVTNMGNQFLGSAWGVTLVALCGAGWAIWRRRHDVALAGGGAAGLVWCVGLFAMSWQLDLFLPRYFVVAFAVIATAVLVQRGSGVRSLVVVAAAALSVAGSLAWPSTEIPPSWCSTSNALEAAAQPGDTVVFVSGATRTPVFACLGRERTRQLAAAVAMLPAIAPDELTDPRSLWVPPIADLDAAVASVQGRFILVWNAEGRATSESVLSAATGRGRSCTTRSFDSISLSTCT